MTFHSEHGQDRWLAEGIFAGKRDGVFVEFGALDGLFHSNSLHFEREMGWRGCLMEANPDCWAALENNRPEAQPWRGAVWDCVDHVLLRQVAGGLMGWSGVESALEPAHRARIDAAVAPEMQRAPLVPAWPLAALLDYRGIAHVDYLSADAEGAEERIFAAFPFARFDIDVIGCEDNWGNPRLAQIFGDAGYDRIGRVGADDFWRKRR